VTDEHQVDDDQQHPPEQHLAEGDTPSKYVASPLLNGAAGNAQATCTVPGSSYAPRAPRDAATKSRITVMEELRPEAPGAVPAATGLACEILLEADPRPQVNVMFSTDKTAWTVNRLLDPMRPTHNDDLRAGLSKT